MTEQIELCRMRHAGRQWRLMRDPATSQVFVEDISDHALARGLAWLTTFELLSGETALALGDVLTKMAMYVLKGCVDRYLAKTSVSAFIVEVSHNWEGRSALAAFDTLARAKMYCEEDPIGDAMRITEMAPLPVRYWERELGNFGTCAERGFDPEGAWDEVQA